MNHQLQPAQHKRRTSIPSAEFEPAIPAIEWPQTNALDGKSTGFGNQLTSIQHILELRYML